MREAPEVRLVRETLEGVLHPATASSVIFEALHEHGGVPSSPEEIRAWIAGPLERRLRPILGEDMAAEILGHLDRMLAAMSPPAAPREVRRRPSRHDDRTRSVELRTETLPVFVLSSRRALAFELSAALGPHVMSAVHTEDADGLRERLALLRPAFVLIDASDFPSIDPRELMEMLARIGDDVVKAIWGADLPYGSATLAHAQERGVELTTFDRLEGIAPLMDMIRSRRA